VSEETILSIIRLRCEIVKLHLEIGRKKKKLSMIVTHTYHECHVR
jgi:hypothetical protein